MYQYNVQCIWDFIKSIRKSLQLKLFPYSLKYLCSMGLDRFIQLYDFVFSETFWVALTAFIFTVSGTCTIRKGLNGACSVYEYTGSFLGQTMRFKMTSVCGHVMSLDFIGGYIMLHNLIIA